MEGVLLKCIASVMNYKIAYLCVHVTKWYRLNFQKSSPSTRIQYISLIALLFLFYGRSKEVSTLKLGFSHLCWKFVFSFSSVF